MEHHTVSVSSFPLNYVAVAVPPHNRHFSSHTVTQFGSEEVNPFANTKYLRYIDVIGRKDAISSPPLSLYVYTG